MVRYRRDALWLGAGILGAWALRGHLVVGHCRFFGWALHVYAAVGHCCDIWWLGIAGMLGGRALQGWLQAEGTTT